MLLSIRHFARVGQLTAIDDPSVSTSQLGDQSSVCILVKLSIEYFVGEPVSWYSVECSTDVECEE